MKKKDSITISRKSLAGIMAAVPIIAILISKRDVGPLLLFFVGIGCGVIIGYNWKK